jgi:hypothetical protein
MAGSKYNEVQPTKLGMGGRNMGSQEMMNGGLEGGKRKRSKTKGDAKGPQTSMNRNGGSALSQGGNNVGGSRGLDEWPKSLQDFVSRCFGRAEVELLENHKEEFNLQMQQLLQLALNQSAIWTTNWAMQKLPILDGVPSLSLQPMAISLGQPSNVAVNMGYVPSYVPSPTQYIDSDDDFKSKQRKRQRAARFEAEKPLIIAGSRRQESSSTIVGRCGDLEKNYLRLTTEPDPDKVRPQQILEKSMALVLSKYQETSNYSYVINQFKSIRQDLTVQHIKNDFTIHVYETNARVSLENNDLGEFNQCQSQLKLLYYQKRKENKPLQFYGAEVEFLIYRFIYMMMTSNCGEIYKLKMMFLKEYSKYHKTKKEKRLFEFIDDLFQLNQDILLGNYHSFFKIVGEEKYDVPLAYQLVNNYIANKNRVKALCTIAKSYRTITSQYIIDELQFKNVTNLVKFLKEYGLSDFLVDDLQGFDCLSSRHVLGDIIQRPDFKKVDIKGQI